MGQLTIGQSGLDDSQTIALRYRVAQSNSAYVTSNHAPADFPLVINGLTDAQYEIGMNGMAPNGAWSGWQTTFTSGCPMPAAFTAVKSGNNIVATVSLTGAQTKISIKITDPNNGVTVNTYDLGGQEGSVTIAIPTPTLYGNYIVQGAAICNNTTNPVYMSNYTTGVTVQNPNPAANNVFLVNNSAQTVSSVVVGGFDPFPSLPPNTNQNYQVAPGVYDVVVNMGEGASSNVTINGVTQATAGGSSFSQTNCALPITVQVENAS